MMRYLFGGEYPLFTHIKMEMGNDGNNSTGAEACTMRYENEEADASRSPGFVMAADAKKINPNVKISILRWEMPAWVASKWSSDRTGAGYEAVYKWYKETIFDAYEKYGYVVDFVDPDKNETTDPNEDFIKWFSNRVKKETDFPDYMDQAAIDAYHNIRIIASDENKTLQIVPSMRSDNDLYNAVDIIGSIIVPVPRRITSKWRMWTTRRYGTARGVQPLVIQSYRKTRRVNTVVERSEDIRVRWLWQTALSMRLPDLAEPTIFSSRLSVPSMKASSMAIKSC